MALSLPPSIPRFLSPFATLRLPKGSGGFVDSLTDKLVRNELSFLPPFRARSITCLLWLVYWCVRRYFSACGVVNGTCNLWIHVPVTASSLTSLWVTCWWMTCWIRLMFSVDYLGSGECRFCVVIMLLWYIVVDLASHVLCSDYSAWSLSIWGFIQWRILGYSHMRSLTAFYSLPWLPTGIVSQANAFFSD